jgi:hypothetical protein
MQLVLRLVEREHLVPVVPDGLDAELVDREPDDLLKRDPPGREMRARWQQSRVYGERVRMRLEIAAVSERVPVPREQWVISESRIA